MVAEQAGSSVFRGSGFCTRRTFWIGNAFDWEVLRFDPYWTVLPHGALLGREKQGFGVTCLAPLKRYLRRDDKARSGAVVRWS
jgi:hypothetical protein